MTYTIVNNKDNTFYSMFRGFVKEYPDSLVLHGLNYARKTVDQLSKEDPTLDLLVYSDYGGKDEEAIYSVKNKA